MTIKEGEPIFLDIKVSGEPPPEVTWVINDKTILQSSHRHVDNVPYNTKFYNDTPERKDSGTYKITAVNKYGTDTAEFELTVVCKFFNRMFCSSCEFLSFISTFS